MKIIFLLIKNIGELINIMKKPDEHDENGINGYCIAFWKDSSSCSIRQGPKTCPSSGDANQCVLKHPELYRDYYKKKILKGLRQIIRKNIQNPRLVDINKISIEIMRKYCIIDIREHKS